MYQFDCLSYYYVCLFVITALADEFDNNKVYNELDWNQSSTITRNPYMYAKTCAGIFIASAR